MWFVTNNNDLRSFDNVYKHQGTKTAQYGLEIIFYILFLGGSVAEWLERRI